MYRTYAEPARMPEVNFINRCYCVRPERLISYGFGIGNTVCDAPASPSGRGRYRTLSRAAGEWKWIDPQLTGRSIRRLIRSSGMTVREVSEALGLLTDNPVYKWMRGEGTPSLDNLYVLSQMFHVTINDILEGTAGKSE